MVGSPMRLSVISAAAFVLSLGCGVLISQAALIASLLGFPLPIANNAPGILLQTAYAVILSIGAYGVLGSIFVTVAVCLDLWAIRNQFISLIADGKAAQLKAGDWHLIFFGAIAEPLGLRLISQGQSVDDSLFCVATAYVPAQGRRETWKFYQQSLIRCQVWTALGLLTFGAFAFSIGKSFDIFQEIRPAIQPVIGEAALGVLFFIGLSFVAANEIIERFLDTLSSFPFKLELSLRLNQLRNSQGNDEFRPLPALTNDSNKANTSYQIDRHNEATLDPELLRTWIEGSTSSLIGVIEQKIAPSLLTAENLLIASGASANRLDQQLVTISEVLRDGFISQRDDVLRSIDAAHNDSRESVQELAAALHALLEEIGQRRSDRSGQNGHDLDIETNKVSTQLSEIIGSFEVFSGQFLPVAKNVEAADGRLLAALEHQEKTFDRLNHLLGELTTALSIIENSLKNGHTAILQPNVAYEESVDRLETSQMVDSDEIMQELNALLHELDQQAGPEIGKSSLN